MYDNKLTVFLSHSHKDIEKVRKIRDILEILGCEPLMFFLKCLDDNNGELEDFIKREIDARNVFLYCRSRNAEGSEWVQKELEYIKSRDKSRIYTVDIDNDFCGGTVSLLNNVVNMIKNNNVFVSYPAKARRSARRIISYLSEAGMNVVSIDNAYGDWMSFTEKAIERAAKEGVVVIVENEGEKLTLAQAIEMEKALKEGAKILRVVVKKDVGYMAPPPGAFGRCLPGDIKYMKREAEDKDAVYVDEMPSKSQLDRMYASLTKI